MPKNKAPKNIEWGTLKLNDLKPGDKVIADDGFTCIKAWSCLEVFAGEDKNLYIPCKAGDRCHYLDGQLDGNDCIVGLARAPEKV